MLVVVVEVHGPSWPRVQPRVGTPLAARVASAGRQWEAPLATRLAPRRSRRVRRAGR